MTQAPPTLPQPLWQGSCPSHKPVRLGGAECDEGLRQLGGDWRLREGRLVASYRFADYTAALRFVNRVALVAEQQNHHPDLTLTWGRVDISLWTHDVGGLSQLDFILAAQLSTLAR